MFNEFLTQTLQVIIVADVVGVIAYFVLSGAKSRSREAAATTPATADIPNSRNSLWHKLIHPRKAIGLDGKRPQLAAVRGSDPTLPGALGQLRSVLDNYRTSLA